tara:strand:+ start:1431 stop:2018 length:588 start_codon:yes stop_codon:yes gene_type:complete
MTETTLDSLVVKIRGDSADLRDELSAIKREFDGLDQIAAQTGEGLTRIFSDFARSGELNFKSLGQVAQSVLADIANSAIQSGLSRLFGDSDSGMGNALGSFFGSLFGRAGGGTVGARQPYLVGERGPELFVPSGAGRILPRAETAHIGGAGAGRAAPQITINITNQGGGQDMTRRSAGQVAVAVRRAMDRAERDL